MSPVLPGDGASLGQRRLAAAADNVDNRGRKDVPAALKRRAGRTACVQEDRQKRRCRLAEPPHQGAARGLCLSPYKLFLANDTGKLCAFSRVPPGGSQIVDNMFNNVILLAFLGCLEQ